MAISGNIYTRPSRQGRDLKSDEIRWYKTNDAGMEVEYFNMLLEGVRMFQFIPRWRRLKTRTTITLRQ